MESTKLSNKVVTQIIDMIQVQRKYDVGDKLPNEKELSSEFGVSRTTIREAIGYLVAQNVLEIRRGKGTYVSEQSDVTNSFEFDQLKYMHLKIRDLYELRLMLEPQMAYYAAIRATDEEIQEIIRLGELIDSTQKEEDAEGNKRFHTAIARATHNEFAIRIAELTNDALVQSFKNINKKQTLFKDTLLDHRMIMEFLAIRDAEGVKNAMQLHMKHSMIDYTNED